MEAREENMTKIYIPSPGPLAWKGFLANPEKHWRTGYSARTLAHCWENAGGLPPEIAALFDSDAELLIALPEHKVPLRGGGRASQNDLFALVRATGRMSAVTIEGKVEETFGPSVGSWLENASAGKKERLVYLCNLLGLDTQPHSAIRYQLMHRTASAIIEAHRFGAGEAAMIVHSFSAQRSGFADFSAFADLLGVKVSLDTPAVMRLRSGLALRLGWACGDPKFLEC